MAGSYYHVVTDDGNLGSNDFVVDMLENGGDVFEAIEEMYGMIWFLTLGHASTSANAEERVAQMKAAVENAHQNYKRGLTISEEVHRLSPDQRRD
jgi:hypothetical protein